MKKTNKVFGDKWFLSKLFYQIKMQAATNWSRHFKKHQTFDLFQTTDFNAIFKNYIFPSFLKIICSIRKITV